MNYKYCEDNKKKILNNNNKTIYLVLPYIGDNSEIIKNKLKKLIHKTFKNIDIKVIFKAQK